MYLLFLTSIMILILIQGVSMILAKNPIYSIILFVGILGGLGVLLLLIPGNELLGLILLIVYAGAIAVLFLFVVMMLNIRLIDISLFFWGYLPISFIGIMLFIYEFWMVTIMSEDNMLFRTTENNHALGSMLLAQDILTSLLALFYTYTSSRIILIGVILLLAMLGSISLTLRSLIVEKQQFIFLQLEKQIITTLRLERLCIY